jgi:hypothetical protein
MGAISQISRRRAENWFRRSGRRELIGALEPHEVEIKSIPANPRLKLWDPIASPLSADYPHGRF